MNVFKAHSKPVYELAFSPDGQYLLSSGGDEIVRLWSLPGGSKLAEWPGSTFHSPIAFSPDSLYVGTGGYTIRVWPVELPQSPTKTSVPLVEVKGFVESCCFSPDGAVFAASGSENPIRRWQMPSGEPLDGGWGGTRTSNEGKRFPVGGLAYHPGGAIVANCFAVFTGKRYDSVVHLWNAHSGELIDTLALASGPAHPNKIVFSPDGELLVAETGPTLHVWNMASRTEVVRITLGKKHVKDFAFTRNGAALLALDGDTSIRSWSTTDWTENPPIPLSIGKLTALAIAPDGRAAAGSVSGRVTVWSL